MNHGFAALIPRWCALASQLLGWSPDTFWRATPAELALALGNPEAAADHPLSRDEFEHLMESERNGRDD